MLHELKEKNGKKLCMASASNSVAFLKIMYIINLSVKDNIIKSSYKQVSWHSRLYTRKFPLGIFQQNPIFSIWVASPS